MDNYYQYFVDKGNHPNKDDILKQEELYSFQSFQHDDALFIVNHIVEEAKKIGKPVGVRIFYHQQIILQYIMDDMDVINALSWLSRKEKMVAIAKHSSYYAFLDNMKNHCYDKYITNDHYALCGGSFPLIEDNKLVGTITSTGLRPHEDHGIIIKALKKLKERKGDEEYGR